MKRILFFLIIILCFSPGICNAQSEPYIIRDIESVIANQLDHFFNSMNFDSILQSDEKVGKSVLNEEYINRLIKNDGYGALDVTTSIIPSDLISIKKESFSFAELMDSVAQWFPICQDPNFTSDADYLLNMGGDGSITYYWNEKGRNFPHTSFYFQNKLYITVGLGLSFSCDYFNKNDSQCFYIIEQGAGISRKISVAEIEWQKDASGAEFFYQNRLQRNIVLTSISSAYKPYVTSDLSRDTVSMEIKSGLIYKKALASDIDSITISDSSVFVNPNPIAKRSYNYDKNQFYFSFILDVPDLKNWKASRIKPHLVKISTNTPPPIMEIVEIGPGNTHKNKFHLDVSACNNFIQWNGTHFPSTSTGKVLNNSISPGVDLLLNYRFNEKPFGVSFGVKAGVGLHEYSTLLNNFMYKDSTKSGSNGFGNFIWNYNASIDQLKTTFRTVEPSILFGIVYKPSLRGQSLNLDLDFSVGYKYSAIIGEEQFESTGMNASITTKGQYTDFPVLLEKAPDYNFKTFSGNEVTDNIKSSISRNYSSLLFSFQPSLRLREKVSIFMNVTYAYGITNMATSEFSYVDQTPDGKILFSNPIYNNGKNNLTISSWRLSFGLSIPLNN